MNELYQALTLLIKVVLLILSLLILPLSAPILAGISRYSHRRRYRNEIERAARPRRR